MTMSGLYSLNVCTLSAFEALALALQFTVIDSIKIVRIFWNIACLDRGKA